MKKTIVLFLISLFTLQSCNINTEIIYHKDAASSVITDIDTREFMAEMQAMTPDSLQDEKFKDMDKFPTIWTSMYDMLKKEGKLKTENQDTIKILKKFFLKSVKEDHKPVPIGYSFKMDHITPNDYELIKNFNKDEKLPFDQNVLNTWDGKTLTINTDFFNAKNIEEVLQSKGSKEEAQQVEGMMMMFFKNIGTTLKFESKIKSITGKHDWLKQVDDYSVRIVYDLKALYDKDSKLKNADKKIIIVTE
ncbi:hypothetical protein J2795_003759 [Chryseobacterium bernardetii]|uniref:Uncharacterized protein n=2 Tax=Chryseobacterium TaxID=59732 RepID=A0ACC6IZA4_9FLAO|nr:MULTISPECIES: hypothetical protein [Chryseobacterium]MDR6372810.1 hypothetical protein [Chryseobacterium vietnamense]MDR6443028.1 hypothetical protein [Chryseobacterium bernardetii]MDR6460990.1 hypothetical protein [Chryseobacterium vietnamense]